MKKTKKLSVRLESIRNLSSDSLHRVAGGAINDSKSCEWTCQYTDGCPNTEGKDCGRTFTVERG